MRPTESGAGFGLRASSCCRSSELRSTLMGTRISGSAWSGSMVEGVF